MGTGAASHAFPCTLSIACSEHGPLIAEPVTCRHECDELTTQVVHAHRASYGAACTRTVHIEILPAVA
jgi:hypothetical protein